MDQAKTGHRPNLAPQVIACQSLYYECLSAGKRTDPDLFKISRYWL